MRAKSNTAHAHHAWHPPPGCLPLLGWRAASSPARTTPRPVPGDSPALSQQPLCPAVHPHPMVDTFAQSSCMLCPGTLGMPQQCTCLLRGLLPIHRNSGLWLADVAHFQDVVHLQGPQLTLPPGCPDLRCPVWLHFGLPARQRPARQLTGSEGSEGVVTSQARLRPLLHLPAPPQRALLSCTALVMCRLQDTVPGGCTGPFSLLSALHQGSSPPSSCQAPRSPCPTAPRPRGCPASCQLCLHPRTRLAPWTPECWAGGCTGTPHF